jgi:hypothetical protein
MAARIGISDLEMLKLAQHEVIKKNGFYDFVYELRTHPELFSTIKIHDLRTLFENSTTWTSVTKSSGHVAFFNPITKIKVEFTAHKTRKSDGVMPQGNAHHILDLVQRHMNILANNVYKINNWSEKPNFQSALNNFHI